MIVLIVLKDRKENNEIKDVCENERMQGRKKERICKGKIRNVAREQENKCGKKEERKQWRKQNRKMSM